MGPHIVPQGRDSHAGGLWLPSREAGHHRRFSSISPAASIVVGFLQTGKPISGNGAARRRGLGSLTLRRRYESLSSEETPAKMIVVTTSWDDGDRCDLRLAEMLSAHGMAGTFYILVEPFHAGRQLSTQQMRDLAAEKFEIGGHSVSHRNFTELSYE